MPAAGVVPVAMATIDKAKLGKLTRRHGIRIATEIRCSVEECVLAVGDVVDCSSVLAASRMNGAVVMFLESIEKVNTVVQTGIVIKDTFIQVMPLVRPAKRITISNVPPYMTDEALINELTRYGQVISTIKMIHYGGKSEQSKHVICYRRQVYMVLKSGVEELNVAFKFKIDGFDHVIFVSSDNMKCFGCGQEGHLRRSCPVETGEGTSQASEYSPIRADINHLGGVINKSGNVEVKINGVNEGTSVEVNRATGGENDTVSHTQTKVGESEDVVKMGDVRKNECAEIAELIVGVESVTSVGSSRTVTQDREENTVAESSADGDSAEDSNNDMQGNLGIQDNSANALVESEIVDINTVTQSIDGESIDIDSLVDNETLFKIPSGKRKMKTKWITVSEKKGKTQKATGQSDEQKKDYSSLTPDDSDSDLSDTKSQRSRRSAYTLGRIRAFLIKTKNMKGVAVEDFFPDRKLFIDSAQSLMRKEGEEQFTMQEIYRLKKLVQKLKLGLQKEDGYETS